jgi:uncharacterized ferritin-like protein (DUF455 family)
MNITDFATQILCGESLADKLIQPADITFSKTEYKDIPAAPARNKKISFNSKQLRFPRGHFHLDEKKAMALSSFANHELLAIEMMAAALLIFDHSTDQMQRFKLGIVKTIKDEQKHFLLYTNRLKDLGYEFGDFPINDFFWRQMKSIKTPDQYLAIMCLTFEAANLDFAHFYEKFFREVGDVKTANILKVVYEDEISHVAFGVNYLEKWRANKSLWEYYNENLPYPLTAARSKGKNFVVEARKKAKMDEDFISKLSSFDDGFRVTSRKEWK